MTLSTEQIRGIEEVRTARESATLAELFGLYTLARDSGLDPLAGQVAEAGTRFCRAYALWFTQRDWRI